MKEKSYEQKKEISIAFMKEAFCVDGEVRFVDPEKFVVEVAMELNDSKRGRFFIGKLTNKSHA